MVVRRRATAGQRHTIIVAMWTVTKDTIRQTLTAVMKQNVIVILSTRLVGVQYVVSEVLYDWEARTSLGWRYCQSLHIIAARIAVHTGTTSAAYRNAITSLLSINEL